MLQTWRIWCYVWHIESLGYNGSEPGHSTNHVNADNQAPSFTFILTHLILSIFTSVPCSILPVRYTSRGNSQWPISLLIHTFLVHGMKSQAGIGKFLFRQDVKGYCEKTGRENRSATIERWSRLNGPNGSYVLWYFAGDCTNITQTGVQDCTQVAEAIEQELH